MEYPEILEQALQQFGHITGATMQYLPNKTKGQDGTVELRMGKTKTRFQAEVKNELRNADLPAMTQRAGKHPDEWLFICQYIPKPIKEELKKTGFNYLEAAGNCYIHKNGLLFFINDQAVTPYRRPKDGPLWKQAGLKLIFALLTQPDLLNEPYRRMAQAAKIGLGTIGLLLEELKQEGFIREGVKEGQPHLFLDHKEQLINKWVALFPIVMKPKLEQGRFRFLDANAKDTWAQIPGDNFFWGAETAGALLTGFLHPEIFTLYTATAKTQIMKQFRLVPDPNGAIQLMDVFWDETTIPVPQKKPKIVHPLLAYAELTTSLDSRNRETAERIKTKYLEIAR